MNKPATIYYDKLAKYYEQATSAKGAWTPPQMIQKFVGDNITSGSLVLDIGTGQSCSFLKHRDENPKIYGIDISAEMLAICQGNHPEIEVFNGTLEEFRNKNNLSFNLIVSKKDEKGDGHHFTLKQRCPPRLLIEKIKISVKLRS